MTTSFYMFHLDDLAWSKLQSNNIYQNVRGIQVMTAMNIPDAINKITHHLNHKNPYVYSEAQYSVVRFNGFKGLKFLDTLDKPLSQWQQMRLNQAIKTVSEPDYDSIALWLESLNLSVISFALSLIRKFRIHTLHDNVARLLSHQSVDIRINSIKTLQTIESTDTLGFLLDCFNQQEDLVKVEILKFIDRAGNRNHNSFLKTILENEYDIYIQIETVNLLKKYKEYDYLQLKSNDSSIDPKLRKVLQNALSKQL